MYWHNLFWHSLHFDSQTLVKFNKEDPVKKIFLNDNTRNQARAELGKGQLKTGILWENSLQKMVDL